MHSKLQVQSSLGTVSLVEKGQSLLVSWSVVEQLEPLLSMEKNDIWGNGQLNTTWQKLIVSNGSYDDADIKISDIKWHSLSRGGLTYVVIEWGLSVGRLAGCNHETARGMLGINTGRLFGDYFESGTEQNRIRCHCVGITRWCNCVSHSRFIAPCG